MGPAAKPRGAGPEQSFRGLRNEVNSTSRLAARAGLDHGGIDPKRFVAHPFQREVRLHMGARPPGETFARRFAQRQGVGEGLMKAAFSADGRQLLLATTQGSLKVRDVEDLPMLLRRGCKALDSFVANPATYDSVKKRLSFCGR